MVTSMEQIVPKTFTRATPITDRFHVQKLLGVIIFLEIAQAFIKSICDGETYAQISFCI